MSEHTTLRQPRFRRLLLGAMVLSLCLALISSLALLTFEYPSQRAALEGRLDQVADSIAEGLALGLASQDPKMIEGLLTGALRVEEVSHVSLTSGPMRYALGAPVDPERDLLRRHDIRLRNGDSRVLGQLALSAPRELLYDRFVRHAFLTFCGQIFWMSLVSLLLLGLVHKLYGRSLRRLLAEAHDLRARVGHEQEPQSPAAGEDALDHLQSLLHQLRERLENQSDHLYQSEQRIDFERRQAEQASTAKNLFLANISHELRTPMNGVLGYASLLLDMDLAPEQREYVQSIQNSAEALLAIVNDILDISRIEAGRLPLEIVPFDLRDVLNDVVGLLGHKAEAKGLAMEVRVDPATPVFVEGDPVRVRQIVINLVSNAIKFTQQGHVLITAEPVRGARSAQTIRFAVEDSGPGMDPSLAGFASGENGIPGPVPRKPGHGLGLAVCRQLVELMHGQMGVASEPGKGSTFWFELPLKPVNVRSVTIEMDKDALRGVRVLVVDSYELSRKITLELLEQWGVEFDAVRSAGEALKLLELSRDTGRGYDLVLLDDFMSDMDGLDFCQIVRSSPSLHRTRMILLSSHPQRGDVLRYRQVGVNGFLGKLLREQYLKPIMQRVLSVPDPEAGDIVTRFDLTLPQQVEEPGPGESALPVLLVEDDDTSRRLVARMLERSGCQVDCAREGREAVSLWRRQRHSLVLMDCIMPVMDGYQATREIRALEDPSAPRSIIVALTASSLEGERERCLEAGMDEFVSKPVKLAVVRDIVRRAQEKASR